MLIAWNNKLIPEVGVLHIYDFKVIKKVCQLSFVKINFNVRLIDYVFILLWRSKYWCINKQIGKFVTTIPQAT